MIINHALLLCVFTYCYVILNNFILIGKLIFVYAFNNLIDNCLGTTTVKDI